MDFHPLEKRRYRKSVEMAKKLSEGVAAAIIDHLYENGDTRLSIPIGQAPRKTNPDFFLRTIADYALINVSSFETTGSSNGYAARLAYDSEASLQASTRRQGMEQRGRVPRSIKSEGLVLVMNSVNISENLVVPSIS